MAETCVTPVGVAVVNGVTLSMVTVDDLVPEQGCKSRWRLLFRRDTVTALLKLLHDVVAERNELLKKVAEAEAAEVATREMRQEAGEAEGLRDQLQQARTAGAAGMCQAVLAGALMAAATGDPRPNNPRGHVPSAGAAKVEFTAGGNKVEVVGCRLVCGPWTLDLPVNETVVAALRLYFGGDGPSDADRLLGLIKLGLVSLGTYRCGECAECRIFNDSLMQTLTTGGTLDVLEARLPCSGTQVAQKFMKLVLPMGVPK